MYEGIEEFDTAIGYARRGYEYFQELPYEHRKAKIVFMLFMTNCYIKMGYLVEAQQIILESLKIQTSDSYNWFLAKWLLIQIEFIHKNYNQAAIHYNELIRHKANESQPDYRKENLNLCGGYLDFLALTVGLESHEAPGKHGINKLIRTSPEYDPDRQKINVPTLIIQLMFQSYDHNISGMNEAISRLKKYGKTKLRLTNPNYRTNCFIKMIKCIPDGNFHPAAINRRAEKYLNQLKSVNFQFSEDHKALEIIPYEDIWDMLMAQLGRHKRKVHRVKLQSLGV